MRINICQHCYQRPIGQEEKFCEPCHLVRGQTEDISELKNLLITVLCILAGFGIAFWAIVVLSKIK